MPAPAPMQRESVGLIVVAVLVVALLPLGQLLALVWLISRLLTAGDERRQPVDIAAPIIATLLVRTGRLLLVLWIGLRLRRQIRLWLARTERRQTGIDPRLLPEILITIVVEGFVARIVVGTREVRIVLAELFLRRGDQPEIMFGVLVVVFCRNRIA